MKVVVACLFFLCVVFVFLLLRLFFTKRHIEALLLANEQMNKQQIEIIVNLTQKLHIPLGLLKKPLLNILEMAHGKSIKSDLEFINSQTNEIQNRIHDIIAFESDLIKSKGVKYSNIEEIIKKCCGDLEEFARLKNVDLRFISSNNPIRGVVNESILKQIIMKMTHYFIVLSSDDDIVEVVASNFNKNHENIQDNNRGNWEYCISIRSNIKCIFKSRCIYKLVLLVCPDFNRLLNSMPHMQSLLNLVSDLQGEVYVRKSGFNQIEFNLFLNNSENQFLVNDNQYSYIQNKKRLLKERHTPNILIVEKSHDMSFYLKQLLAVFGEINIENSGIEALRYIEGCSPDLIIANIDLLGIDGIELTKKIKKGIKSCHIPVVIISERSEGGVVNQATIAGANYFLSYPFDEEYLHNLVMNIFKERDVLTRKINHATNVSFHSISDQKDKDFMKDVDEYIEHNLSDPELKYDKLAKHMNVSVSLMFKKMKEIVGKSPGEYIKDKRIEYAANLIVLNGNSVSEASFLSGFNSISYFSEEFKKRFGMNASEYKSIQLIN